MKKTIALVEIHSAKRPGHYKAFMSFFVQSLLNLGHNVLVLIPDKEAIDEWVQEHYPHHEGRYSSYEFVHQSKDYKRFGRFNTALKTLSAWINVKKHLRKIEQQEQHTVDLVFFNWLDSFLANYLSPHILDWYFPYPWAGLYFHPWHMRLYPQKLNPHPSLSEIDAALVSKKCQGITIHDEGILDIYKARLNNKKVVFFPEIADGTAPNPQFDLVAKIKEKAQGRTIVGMIGFMHYKGLNTLIKVARQANPDDFLFVFVGKWSRTGGVSYTPERIQEANEFFDNPPEHCFVHLGFINEGADFNALFSSFDIPYLVYDSFPSSSNNLTKAAIFDKLVMASKGFCVGDDVEKYELGLTIEQGNVEESIKTLYKLQKRTHTLKPRFEEYRKIHSKEVLEDKFSEILP